MATFVYTSADAGYEDAVKEFYANHGAFYTGDAGLDLYCVQDQTIPARSFSVKVPLRICINTKRYGRDISVYMYPRSSTGLRTPIRLSNSVGVIDRGYRGPLAAIVDNVSDEDFTMKRGERYFQLCAPDLAPMTMVLADELDESARGRGGFGSTGK